MCVCVCALDIAGDWGGGGGGGGGNIESVSVKVTKHRLEWLGHVVRIPDHRISKLILLGCMTPRISTTGRPRGDGETLLGDI